ncbi:hypothetical protein C0995_010563, partial [Termitomyces sp. Mi166
MIIALAAVRQLSTQLPTGSTSSQSEDLVPTSSCNNRAIHPNIPKHSERPLLRRLKIFALALVAPELIVLWALRQWFVSRRLARMYKGYGWTQTHSFFAIMGGFQVCKPDDTDNPKTLHPDDIRPYLENYDIVISKEEIMDRSKGDILAKCLVLLQVTWFILQMLARAIQHLAISELEIVTLAFALLNLMIYFCWWNKPLD